MYGYLYGIVILLKLRPMCASFPTGAQTNSYRVQKFTLFREVKNQTHWMVWALVSDSASLTKVQAGGACEAVWHVVLFHPQWIQPNVLRTS